MAIEFSNKTILNVPISNSKISLSRLKASVESAIQNYASAFGYWLELKS